MRIALVSDHASPLTPPGSIDAGGQNVYVAEVARHQRALGHEVDVFTRRDDPALPAEVVTSEGVRVVHVDAGPARAIPKERLLPWMDAFAASVERTARIRRYDVVHANFWMSAIAGMRLQRSLGTPLVVTFHALGKIRRREQGTADESPGTREAIETAAIRAADRVIAECPQDEYDLCELYDADLARIALVPAGYEPRELSPRSRYAARKKIGVPLGGPLILHVGRFVPRKGIDDAIRGASVVLARKRHARMIVVGGHPDDPASVQERARLERIARELEVRKQVAFAGSVSRELLRDFYAAADVFVTTPWYEPFGITPVESMACGTPVIGSAVGGIGFTVRDGVTGFLVPPRAPEAIAEALTEALADRHRLRRMGRAAARHVRPTFTWRRITEQLVGAYADAIAAPRGVALDAAVGAGWRDAS
jgi:D-inositol-3-phosphate glycosyltransferase